MSILKKERREMKREIAKLEDDLFGVKCWHVMHFLLSVMTGIWFVVWVVCAMKAKSKKAKLKVLIIKLERQLETLEDEIEEDRD